MKKGEKLTLGRIPPAWPAFPSLLLAQIRATAPTNGPTVLVALALVWSHCHRHVGHPCQALLPPTLWSHWPMGPCHQPPSLPSTPHAHSRSSFAAMGPPGVGLVASASRASVATTPSELPGDPS
jgi:hypothetical protein